MKQVIHLHVLIVHEFIKPSKTNKVWIIYLVRKEVKTCTSGNIYPLRKYSPGQTEVHKLF